MFATGFAAAICAIVTIRKAGTRVETNKPTTTIVANGPYRFTRDPIYIGMFVGQIGLAIGINSLWILATLVPFYLIIRYGVIAREEISKFHDLDDDWISSVRRRSQEMLGRHDAEALHQIRPRSQGKRNFLLADAHHDRLASFL